MLHFTSLMHAWLTDTNTSRYSHHLLLYFGIEKETFRIFIHAYEMKSKKERKKESKILQLLHVFLTPHSSQEKRRKASLKIPYHLLNTHAYFIHTKSYTSFTSQKLQFQSIHPFPFHNQSFLSLKIPPPNNYCCFFCADGPISLSNAPYETWRLDTAFNPTYKILRRRMPTTKPMKMPGVKYWYFSNSGLRSGSVVELSALILKSRFKSIWEVESNSAL